jgi:acetyl esterase/lipase
MKLLIVLAGIVFILTLVAGCSGFKATDVLNASLSSTHYETRLDIAYGTDQRQKLDIYYPTTSADKAPGKNKPVIVFVYGGAWKHGDKKDFKFIAHAFTGAGYRVVIPNYRLYPAVKFPLFVDDVANAIAYMERHEKPLFGNLSHGMVLMGHSAGAHTAALLATDQSYFKSRNIKIPLKGLVGLAGPYDLVLEDPEVTPIFLPIIDPNKAKPARLVHRNMPPVLLLHGLKDTRVKPFHTRRFIQSLQKSGIRHQAKMYENVSHISILASIAKPLRSLNTSYKDILAFLSTLD